MKKVSAAETTIFVYDASGVLIAEYSGEVSQEPRVSYLTTDHLGSPRVTTDASGEVISKRDFRRYGEETRDLTTNMRIPAFTLFGIVSILAGFCVSGVGQCVGRITDNPQDKRISIDLDRQPVDKLFRKLMVDNNIAIGFEESSLDGHHDYLFPVNPGVVTSKRERDGLSMQLSVGDPTHSQATHLISIKITDGTISDIMDAVVKQMGNYAWSINEGVVNITPTRGRNSKLQNLLNTKIAKYDLRDGQTVGDITSVLRVDPDFNSAVESNGLVLNISRYGADFVIKAKYGRSLAGNLKVSDMTVLELLNRATIHKGCGGWYITAGGTTSDGRTIFRIDI